MPENNPQPHRLEIAGPPIEHLLAPGITQNGTPEQSPVHEAERQQNLEQSRLAIDREATPAADTKVENHTEKSDGNFMLSKALKDEAFQQRLTAVQRHLGRPARLFSSVIHQPVIDSLSRSAEKTIANPTSLLWGAVVAFIGTSLLVIISRRYGFTYNYLTFALFFISGWLVGLLGTLAVRSFKRPNR